MRKLVLISIIFLAGLSLAGISCEFEPDLDGFSCNADADCPSGKTCQNGTCASKAADGNTNPGIEQCAYHQQTDVNGNFYEALQGSCDDCNPTACFDASCCLDDNCCYNIYTP
jgi:hypothetical protein